MNRKKKKRKENQRLWIGAHTITAHPPLTPISISAAVPPGARWINPMEFSDPRSLFQDIRLRELNGFRGIDSNLSLLHFYVHTHTHIYVRARISIHVPYLTAISASSSSKATVRRRRCVRFLRDWSCGRRTRRRCHFATGNFVLQGELALVCVFCRAVYFFTSGDGSASSGVI